MELKVGQKLWFVSSYRRNDAREVVIERVGRKWAYAGRLKINKETLQVDGGTSSSPGMCYLSREIYEQGQTLIAMWRNTVDRIPRNPPKDMTLEKINQIKAIIWGDSDAIL